MQPDQLQYLVEEKRHLVNEMDDLIRLLKQRTDAGSIQFLEVEDKMKEFRDMLEKVQRGGLEHCGEVNLAIHDAWRSLSFCFRSVVPSLYTESLSHAA